ncbi:hypothetical protein PAXINDRAFT_169100 [Paxillus involutus ATCC 200175]|uniref:Uncharacterized protein n=1 Tax=Paxillus involutus ATCC 200175 TaxID=664439 RepID=A0A0C9TJB4_PAXIN|nr:hypothetical protein PAXINDRAFT_169100 [Paxillus involutus ATCC 200175]
MNHSTAPTSALCLTEDDILVAANEHTITMDVSKQISALRFFLLMIGHHTASDAMDSTALNGPKSAGALTRSGTHGNNCPMSSLSSSWCCLTSDLQDIRSATLGSHVPPAVCSLAPHSINDGGIRLVPSCITPAFD